MNSGYTTIGDCVECGQFLYGIDSTPHATKPDAYVCEDCLPHHGCERPEYKHPPLTPFERQRIAVRSRLVSHPDTPPCPGCNEWACAEMSTCPDWRGIAFGKQWRKRFVRESEWRQTISAICKRFRDEKRPPLAREIDEEALRTMWPEAKAVAA